MFTQLSSLMIQVLAYFFTTEVNVGLCYLEINKMLSCHNNNLSTNHPCFATNSHTFEVNVNAKYLNNKSLKRILYILFGSTSSTKENSRIDV